MSATWRKVLTDANIAGGVASSNTSNLATGAEVAAAIAAASAAAGSGDITSIAPFSSGGIIIHADLNLDGTFNIEDATQGAAQVQVQAGDGITVNADGVSVASTLAGNGLNISSGVMTVDLGTNSGLQTDASNKLVTRLDPNTLHVDSTTAGIDIKDGGVQLVHLDSGMVYTSADSDSLTFTDDTKILTASAINDNFPNVSTAVGAETYVQMGAGQVLSVNEINISDHTNLGTAVAASNPAVQGDVVITLANSTLSAEAINLGTDDAVSFAGVTSTAQLNVTSGGASISGSVNIQGDLSVTGTTTTVNSTEVLIEDHVITLANTSSTPSQSDASESGLDVYTSSTESHRPRFAWITPQSSNLTGWKVRGHNGSATVTTDGLVDISVMDFQTGPPTSGAQSTDLSSGVGAFWFNSSTKDLYLRVS